MSNTINLRERSFQEFNTLKEANPNKKILEVVDEVTREMILNHAKLINDIEKNNISKNLLDDEIDRYLKRNHIVLGNTSTFEEVLQLVKSYLWGYGSLQQYLEDGEVSDVAIKGLDDTWIKKQGKRIKVDISFPSIMSLENFAYSVCIKNGGNLSDIGAMIVLSDTTTLKNFKLRIVVSKHPVNVTSPSIIIRKIPKNKYVLEDLLKLDMFNNEMYEYFKAMMKSGLNVIWGGKGASGKTTHMNACIDYIPVEKSKLFMQESEELYTDKGNAVFKMVNKKVGESDIEYTLQNLIVHGLLEDVDVMCVGESKGAEAMDLIDAGYTGHIIYTSTHSPSADKTLSKVVMNMKKSGTDYKRESLLEMLAEIDVVIYMKDFKCIEVTEIAGFDHEKNEIIYNKVFEFITEKVENGTRIGRFERVGNSCEKVQKKFDLIGYKMN